MSSQLWSRAQSAARLRPAPTKPSDNEGLLVVGSSENMAGCVQVRKDGGRGKGCRIEKRRPLWQGRHSASTARQQSHPLAQRPNCLPLCCPLSFGRRSAATRLSGTQCRLWRQTRPALAPSQPWPPPPHTQASCIASWILKLLC